MHAHVYQVRRVPSNNSDCKGECHYVQRPSEHPFLKRLLTSVAARKEAEARLVMHYVMRCEIHCVMHNAMHRAMHHEIHYVIHNAIHHVMHHVMHYVMLAPFTTHCLVLPTSYLLRSYYLPGGPAARRTAAGGGCKDSRRKPVELGDHRYVS